MVSTSSPTITPSFVFSDFPTPFVFNFATPTPTYYTFVSTPSPINYGTPQNPNQIPILRFVIYLACTIAILALILFMSKCNNGPVPATPTAATATSDSAPQNQVDLVKSMSPEERKVYVTNFLKTQKFAENQDIRSNQNTSASSSRSFRVTQSSSLHLDVDHGVGPDISDGDIIDNDDNITSPKAYPSCAICLERFQNGEDICLAQNKECPHEFHLECLFPWLLKSQDCPCCRRDYLSIESILTI